MHSRTYSNWIAAATSHDDGGGCTKRSMDQATCCRAGPCLLVVRCYPGHGRFRMHARLEPNERRFELSFAAYSWFSSPHAPCRMRPRQALVRLASHTNDHPIDSAATAYTAQARLSPPAAILHKKHGKRRPILPCHRRLAWRRRAPAVPGYFRKSRCLPPGLASSSGGRSDTHGSRF